MQALANLSVDKILKSRRRSKAYEYLVSYKESPANAPIWVNEAELHCEKSVLEQFKKEEREAGVYQFGAARPLEQIIGVRMSSDGKPTYIVRFLDSSIAEVVPSERMRSLYMKKLLSFLEKKIVVNH